MDKQHQWKKTNIKKMETVPVPKTQLKHKNTNPSNHLPRINSHLKPQIDKSTLSHVTTPYETRLHAQIKLPERGGWSNVLGARLIHMYWYSIVSPLCPAFVPYFYIHCLSSHANSLLSSCDIYVHTCLDVTCNAVQYSTVRRLWPHNL